MVEHEYLPEKPLIPTKGLEVFLFNSLSPLQSKHGSEIWDVVFKVTIQI